MAASVEELTRVVFDPRTYATGVPHEAFAVLRREAPVVFVEEPALLGWPAGPGFWAVFRHADVRSVLRQPERFSSRAGATQIRDPRTPEDLAFVQQMMLNMDPPEHTRIRSLVAAAFTPKAVAALETDIRRRAHDLVAAVADRGRCDLATDVAADLPLLTLAEVMGVPASDRLLLFDWSNRVIGYQDDEYSASAHFDPLTASPMASAAMAARTAMVPPAPGAPHDPRSRQALADMFAYAHALAAHKRRHPGNDVMSILLAAEADGRGVTTEEFENLFFLFAVAGNETLRNGIPGGLLTLLRHPAQLRRLLADRTLINTAVEEMLRYWTPVTHFRRTATEGTTVGGQWIGAQEKVVVWFASANRDGDVFPDPDAFDVGRTPNEHLAFGAGPHFCLGAHLARMQMRAVVGEILDRLPALALDGEPQRLQSNFQNGVKHLPVRWKPR
jgi:cytochrome P450